MKSLPYTTGLLLASALLLPNPRAQAAAQVGMIPDTECKCVDPEGKEIENCQCFRMFEPDRFTWNFAPFGSSRARIGITLSTSATDADPQGARIESVLEDGPADRAGLQEGDIVTHINGRSLFDPLEDPKTEEELDLDASVPSQRLLYLARNLEPGDEVEIRYLRDNQPRTASLQAEELDDWGQGVMYFDTDWTSAPNVLFRRHEGEAQPETRRFEFAPGGWLDTERYFTTCPEVDEPGNIVFWGTECLGGLRMEELNPKLGEYFGTDRGVLIADVHEDSMLGLLPGDVVLEVGDREATDPTRLRRILRSYEPDEEVSLHIMRQKREMTVSGTLGH